MNSRPMILRFSSGSLTPSSAARNWSAAATTLSCTPVAATKSRSTCSASPSRSSPWSTKTQVSWSPIARCTSAAATAESTPPDSPQITRLPPTWARIASTCSSMMFASVHDGRQPATSYRNRVRIAWPCSVCSTSGWNCTPASPRATSSNAAIGAPADPAVTVNPGGATVTASPWDIHTCCAGGQPAQQHARVGDGQRVRPNSEPPVCATSPPSACVIAWKP